MIRIDTSLKRSTNGHKYMKKKPDIFSHQGNANENHIDIPFHLR
jgi:hypothetical protein